MNKLLFTIFHDENITFHEYYTCNQKQDFEMEKGIVFNLLQNLSAYFLKAKHYKEAREVIKDLEKLGTSNSTLNFRKA